MTVDREPDKYFYPIIYWKGRNQVSMKVSKITNLIEESTRVEYVGRNFNEVYKELEKPILTNMPFGYYV